MKPHLIQIETTTVCNAKCWMCPRSKGTRSKHCEYMSNEIFEIAVSQAVEDLGVSMVVPFIDGEPLADSRMVGFVEWIAGKYPHVEIGWYTNASLLTDEATRRLLQTKKILRFNVSVQGGSRETYERNTGLVWDRTIKNIEQLIEINNQLGNPSSVCANMCVGDNSLVSVEAFKQRWESFPGVTVCLGGFSNFGGLSSDAYTDSMLKGMPRQVCDRATKHVYVFWNGSVGQCSFDLVGSVDYGNLADMRLSDIWFSERMQATRKAHRDIITDLMPNVCRNCNASKFHG